MEFVTVVLATFTMVMLVLGILPFRIPARFMPAAISAAGWGCIELYARLPALVEAAGVAGGVAIVSRYAVAQLPEPWSLDDLLGRLSDLVPRQRLDSPWSRRPVRPVRPPNRPGREIPHLR